MTIFSYTNYAQNFGYVSIGGGGYVTSVVSCPTEQNLFYAKTDVGGIFRWQQATSTWKPLFEWVGDSQTSYLGAESLAVDPKAPNKVYVLVGTSYWNSGKSAILRSDDYGETWEITDVTSQFKANGNGSDRQKGESLAVDPNKGNILFCGTRYNNGLFKSTDSGVSWQKVTSLNVSDASISFVAFDAGSGTQGNATPNIYVGVHREGVNLYVSKDGGATWTDAGGNSEGKPQRFAFSSDGNIYITYTGTVKGIRKMKLSTGAWTNCTPGLSTNKGFSGIDVDPNNPKRLIASTYNMWWNQQPWGWADYIFYSEDGGLSWTEKANKNVATMDKNGIPWIHGAMHWIGCTTFDPYNSNRVFVVSGNGIFVCEDIALSWPTWKFMTKGLEETVMLDMISVPDGPVITSIGDIGGFVHIDVDEYPLTQISQSSGFAYAGKLSGTIARVATNLYLSEDNGATWQELPGTSDEMTKGKVALSADGKTILWKSTVNSQHKCYYTTDKGMNWNPVNGLNFNCIPIGDPVNPQKFYAYNSSDGYCYASIDGGKNFTYRDLAGKNGHIRSSIAVGKEDQLWIALGSGGLKYTTTGGYTFETTTAYYCSAVAVGKSALGTTNPTVYIYGRDKMASKIGIYYSTDMGHTWTRLSDDRHEYGHLANAGIIVADQNVYGRVYRSTAGMGIPYLDVSQTPTAVQIPKEHSEFVLYPNPFNTEINLQAGKSAISQIQIYNMSVSLLKTIYPEQQSVRFGADLRTGVYIVKISGEDGVTVRKIVKK